MEKATRVRAVRYQRPSHSQEKHQNKVQRQEYHIACGLVLLVLLTIVAAVVWGYSLGMEACYNQMMEQRWEAVLHG